MKFNRRQFMTGLATLAGAGLGPAIIAGCDNQTESVITGPASGPAPKRPNFLMIMSDEFNRPPVYPNGTGMPEQLRDILAFEREVGPNNQYANLFPGFTRLRKNAVTFRKHYTASAACVPSRATLLTGQYPTVHKVSQTTGFFKSSDDPGFTFLDPDGVPTVGDWLQAAGYETYYFGKWHVSEACEDLGPWGFPFAAWDGPEPHGSEPANLGTYRDKEFADNTIDFLNSKAQESNPAPWFCVSSYLAPHDISGWPFQWFIPENKGVQTQPPGMFATPPPIPQQGDLSNPSAPLQPLNTYDCPPPSSDPIPLNPGGYPAGVFNPVPTLNEDLLTKPDCHYDMSVKIGICQKSIIPLPFSLEAPNPFQLQGDQFDDWCTAYGEWWTYLHYLLDIQINRVLQTLDETGLAENTIVMFTTDHGDYAGAHGGMVQKWHSAYEEAIRVPMVFSSPLVNPTDSLKQFDLTTSSIDLLPTILGLAGFSAAEQESIRQSIPGHTPFPLKGTDLSNYVLNPTDSTPIPDAEGNERPGVLFITLDEISQMTTVNPQNEGFQAYEKFLVDVELAKLQLPRLESGPVRQPNLVRTLISGDWKYSRYYDPNAIKADQYEMYNLAVDPTEEINLVNYVTGAVRNDINLPGLTTAQIETQRALMAQQLQQQELALL